MTTSYGRVLSEQAYAQSKMLDHSGWRGKLRDGITPSDVDMFFDDNGSILYCEISRWNRDWRDIDTGQRRGYQNIIFGTKNLAIVCKHDVEKDKKIDTYRDINSFHIRACNDKKIVESPVIYGNDRWKNFVSLWFKDAQKAYDWVINNPRDNTQWRASND